MKLSSTLLFRPSRVTASAVIATAAALLPLQTEAALIAYDGFGVGPGGYEVGQGVEEGVGQGIGWFDASWSTTAPDDNLTLTGSLAPSSVNSEDGYVLRTSTGGAVDMSRRYTTTFGGATPVITEAWFSLSLQRNGRERSFVVNPFANNAGTGAGQFIGIGADNGGDLVARMRPQGSNSVVSSATSFDLNLGTNYFIVGQVMFNNSGTADQLNVWVQPSASYTGTLGAANLTVSVDFDTTFSRWSAGTGNPDGEINSVGFDEFRIGNSFADVSPAAVPEPTSAALIGLSIAGLCLIRRRRSAQQR